MPTNTATVLAEIDAILQRGAELLKVVTNRGHRDPQEDAELGTLCVAAIERLTPPGSQYRKLMEKARTESRGSMNEEAYYLGTLQGILKAIRSDYELGRMRSFEERVHSDLFSDFLEMAEYLLDEGLKDPAAVLAGGVLEQHLRKLCSKHGISLPIRPKLDIMNSDLAKQNAFGKNEQKQITAWAGIRNDAAHGDYGKYTPEQVRLMIQGIRHFITQYPA